MRRTIYVGCPQGAWVGSPASLLAQLLNNPPWNHDAWELRKDSYAGNASIDAKNFCSRVMQNPGPVVLLSPIQQKSRTDINQRIGAHVPVVIVEGPVDDAGLRSAISYAIKAFDSGEPQISIDIAVALMLMSKLDRNYMWGGNAKGFMWIDDLKNGRGFDAQYASRLPNVLGILLQCKLLHYKTSQHKRKYALEADRRKDIYEILRTRQFDEEALRRLSSKKDVISVRVLDNLMAPDAPDR